MVRELLLHLVFTHNFGNSWVRVTQRTTAIPNIQGDSFEKEYGMQNVYIYMYTYVQYRYIYMYKMYLYCENK